MVIVGIMPGNTLEEKAREYATEKHKGVLRHDNKTPYIAHPAFIAKALKDLGVSDEKTLAVAWLHDVVEDTGTKLEEIEKEFGAKVACGVNFLTHYENANRNRYVRKIMDSAPEEIQLIKLCDVWHNILTMPDIVDKEKREKGWKDKLGECEDNWLPLALKISPVMYQRIVSAIGAYSRAKLAK
ncbi:MAG TPA: HD domain-containing protein [Candidatus Nanoarchaeia archaeon]|nr:HD domain-containing protein [Candidatus Nanoarchaeia archaeon]